MRHTCSAQRLLSVMKVFLLLSTLSNFYAHHGGEMNTNGIAERESFMSAQNQKEVANAFSTGTKMRMEQLGGRKMVVPRKFEIIKHKPADSHGGATSQVISGRSDNNYNSIGVGESQPQYIHQEQKKEEANIQKNSGILGSPRHEEVHTKTNEWEESKATPTKSSSKAPHHHNQRLIHHQFQQGLLHEEEDDNNIHSTDNSKKTEKEERLLLVEIMNKDYKGVDRPRRKPPINNHLPIN